jgi:hypothetical protein
VTPQEIAREAAKRIRKYGWWQAPRDNAYVVDPESMNCCLFQAIVRETPKTREGSQLNEELITLIYRTAGWELDGVIYPAHMIKWNDEPGRKEKEVLALLEKVAAT